VLDGLPTSGLVAMEGACVFAAGVTLLAERSRNRQRRNGVDLGQFWTRYDRVADPFGNGMAYFFVLAAAVLLVLLVLQALF
jgi:hypothetical protein